MQCLCDSAPHLTPTIYSLFTSYLTSVRTSARTFLMLLLLLFINNLSPPLYFSIIHQFTLVNLLFNFVHNLNPPPLRPIEPVRPRKELHFRAISLPFLRRLITGFLRTTEQITKHQKNTPNTTTTQQQFQLLIEIYEISRSLRQEISCKGFQFPCNDTFCARRSSSAPIYFSTIRGRECLDVSAKTESSVLKCCATRAWHMVGAGAFKALRIGLLIKRLY